MKDSGQPWLPIAIRTLFCPKCNAALPTGQLKCTCGASYHEKEKTEVKPKRIKTERPRGTPAVIYTPAITGTEPDWLKFKDDGNDISLMNWSKAVANRWRESYQEVLADDALVYLAEESSSKMLKRHARRLGELLALDKTTERTLNDHMVCPICRHDWHHHFQGGRPRTCLDCDCGEAVRGITKLGV